MVKFYKLKTEKDLILVKTDRDVSESCIAEIAKRMLDHSRKTKTYYNETSILSMAWLDLLFPCLGDVSFKTYWIDNLEVFCPEEALFICLNKVNIIRKHFEEAIEQLKTEFKDFSKWLNLAKCIEEEKKKGICVEVKKQIAPEKYAISYKPNIIRGFAKAIGFAINTDGENSYPTLAVLVKGEVKCLCSWHEFEKKVDIWGWFPGNYRYLRIGDTREVIGQGAYDGKLTIKRISPPYEPKTLSWISIYEIKWVLPNEIEIYTKDDLPIIVETKKLRIENPVVYYVESGVDPAVIASQYASKIWREIYEKKVRPTLTSVLPAFYELMHKIGPKLGCVGYVSISKIVDVVDREIKEHKFGEVQIHNEILEFVPSEVRGLFSLSDLKKVLKKRDEEFFNKLQELKRKLIETEFWRREILWRTIKWCFYYATTLNIPEWADPEKVVQTLVDRFFKAKAREMESPLITEKYRRELANLIVDVADDLKKLVELYGELSGDWEYVNSKLSEISEIVEKAKTIIKPKIEKPVKKVVPVLREIKHEVTIELTVTKPTEFPPSPPPKKPQEPTPPPRRPTPSPPIKPELGIVEGVVIDAETGEPIYGARVELNGNVTFTDEKGLFRFEVEKGRYRIRVVAPNYYPAEKVIDVEAGEAIRLKILLMKKPKAVKELAKSSLPPAIVTTGLLLVASLAMEKLRR